MREIKFRAWDKVGKEMFSVLMISFPVGKKDFVLSGRGGSTSSKDVELMQFTGLHDKNGLCEIYEGDIVKSSVDKVCDRAVIEWDKHDGRFYGRRIPLPMAENFGLCWVARHCEVIGNIHQNKELLGGEE